MTVGKKWTRVQTMPCGCYIKERSRPQKYDTRTRVFSPACTEKHTPAPTQSDDSAGNYFDDFVDGRGF